MAVGRISGPLLKSNLLRNGIDLAFETDLLYLDVNNQRIGIKNATPQYELDVTGTTQTTNLIVDTQADLADVTFVGNTISTTQPYLNLGTLDNVVYQNKAVIDSIDIEGNVISTNVSNTNLELRPNGTGTVEVHSDMNVTGNIHATGSITADGDITIGDQNTDNIIINAEVASNIIPDIDNTYTLGSDPSSGGKRWNDVWVNNLNATNVVAQSLEVNGVDLTLRQGNIYYVAENGDDANTGDHQNDPFASIVQALSVATAGDTVYVYPGTYTEVFPLTVPSGVTVKGAGIRGVTIQPTVGTNTNTAFLLNGETTIEDLMITGFYSPGYAFEFAPGFTVTTRSPYIRNVTVITAGSTTTTEDPRGFNAGDAGGGAYIDGSVATASSKEASMLFHSATFITPGVDTITATNGVRIEWLNSFTYFANRSFYCFDGTTGKYNDGKTKIRLGGVTGTFAPGDTITFTSTDASTIVNVTVESVDNDVIIVDGRNLDLIGFDTTPASISNGSGATATTILNLDVRDFGAEVRMIGSASIYGNYGLVGDGPGVIIYAIGHNLAYIGNGKEVTNDPVTVIQANEIVELNDAQVRYNSVDHKGDFRVGDLFYVNQQDGTVTFTANDITLDLTGGVTFVTGSDTTFVSGERIDTGNLRFSGNTVESTSGPVNINADNGFINLQNDVNITGNLDVTGNVSIGGNITIGDAANDSIEIIAGINSNLIPATTSTYSLGTVTNTWSNLYVDEVDIDDIVINTNYITTTNSNADLELRANGTGNILVPNNNVEITNDLTIGGTLTAGNLSLTGLVTANKLSTGDILIDDNYITTTLSNSDLELKANGTGSIVLEDFSFSSNVISTTGDMVLEPSTEYVQINTTGALKLPVGTTLDRPAPVAGQIRYNSDLQRFEGYNGTNWINLKGVEDLDGNTKVTAELTEGANDNIIRFDVAGSTIVDIDSSRLNAPRVTVDDIQVDGNVISTVTTDTDLVFGANGTGSVVFDNFAIRDNTITNTVADSVTTFNYTGNGYVKFDNTYGMVLPVGDNTNRPNPAFTETGMMRFNTADARVEVFDGTAWVSVAGTSGSITAIDAQYLAVETVLMLG